MIRKSLFLALLLPGCATEPSEQLDACLADKWLVSKQLTESWEDNQWLRRKISQGGNYRVKLCREGKCRYLKPGQELHFGLSVLTVEGGPDQVK